MASFQKEQDGENTCECDGRANAIPSFHSLGKGGSPIRIHETRPELIPPPLTRP